MLSPLYQCSAYFLQWKPQEGSLLDIPFGYLGCPWIPQENRFHPIFMVSRHLHPLISVTWIQSHKVGVFISTSHSKFSIIFRAHRQRLLRNCSEHSKGGDHCEQAVLYLEINYTKFYSPFSTASCFMDSAHTLHIIPVFMSDSPCIQLANPKGPSFCHSWFKCLMYNVNTEWDTSYR